MKLNLGCGTDIKPGWTNLDHLPLPGVDIVHDATQTPWPIPSSTVTEIVANHFIEHIPRGRHLLSIMEECHRILKPGGTLTLALPHWESNLHVWGDPTHHGPISPRFWEHFADKSNVPNFYTTARFTLTKTRINKCTPGLPPYLSWRLSQLGIGRPSEVIYTAIKA